LKTEANPQERNLKHSANRNLRREASKGGREEKEKNEGTEGLFKR
jgi:hypothetical protein